MDISSSEEEHVKHGTSVLQRMRENNMLAKDSNCVFHASSVEYLRYVVSSDGLKMDSSNTQKILNLPHPYINTCERCQKANRKHGKKYGLLQHIEEPRNPWETINMEWVTGLVPGGK
ncbi:hypothetical protein O181_117471 [Austropuccinia psidii MF-1]|uniref:Uncharacterized protein n=1 Tax=Austropuccinia psidii MF-1 TaxID=1389203 RepID=A0A9Q3KBZ2_9BASI|nr:hypothetical protein [Austropuccinia psidii MF-1]